MWSHSRRLGTRLGPDIAITSTSTNVDRLSARCSPGARCRDRKKEVEKPKKNLPGLRVGWAMAHPAHLADTALRPGGPPAYKRYSASVRAEIGRFAIHPGVAAAAHYLSKKHVSEATVS